MPAPTVLPGRAFQQVDRRSRLLFHWRASDQSLITVNRDSTGVFTRASDGGEVAGQGGFLINPASDDLPRYEWVDTDADGVRDAAALRLEGARTNTIVQSENLSTAGGWTLTRVTADINSTIFAAPDGKYTADVILESTDNATHSFQRNSSGFSTGGSLAASFFFRARGRSDIRLFVYGSTDVGDFFSAEYDLSGGTVSTSTGGIGGTGSLSRAAIKSYGDSWYRCALVGAVGGSHTIAAYRVDLATTAGAVSYQGVSGNGLYSWGGQSEVNAAFETSYAPTAAAAVTRAAETVYWPYTAKPQVETIYVKFIEGGTAQSTAGDRIIHTGAANAATDPRAGIETSAGEYQAFYDDGTTTATAKAVAAPSMGDLVELRWTVSAAGVLTLGQSIKGGAEATVNSTATVVVTRPSFAAARLYLNSGGTSLQGHNSYIAVKRATGAQNMQAMREAF